MTTLARFASVLLALAAPALAGLPSAHAEEIAQDLAGWTKADAPKPGTAGRSCGGQTGWVASVSIEGEAAHARIHMLEARERMSLPFKVETRVSGAVVTGLAVADGWLVSVDEGEYGGSVSWYDPTGSARSVLGSRNVVAFVPKWAGRDDTVLVLEGLAHLGQSRGWISIIRRLASGWVYETLAELPARPGAHALQPDGSLLIAHDEGIDRLVDGKVSTVARAPMFTLLPSSIAQLINGDIYIGMRRYVWKVSAKGDHTWYVPRECKRFRIIEFRPGRPPDCVCVG